MKSSLFTSAERRWVLAFAAFAMLVTTLPYLVGFASQGEDWVFTGFVFAVDDANSYIAKMLAGHYGDWLFRSPYTTMPQDGLLVFLPHLLLGKLAPSPAQHFHLVVLYHLFRIVAGFLVFFASYDFLARFISGIPQRRWGLALVTLGGGLGWLLVLFGRPDWFGSVPLDFNSPESFGFLALYGLPHLALARALLLWGLVKHLSPLPEKDLPRSPFALDKNGLNAGLLWLLLGLAQPLTLLVGWMILGVHLASLALVSLWRAHRGQAVDWNNWRAYFRRAFWAVLLSSPLVLSTFWALNFDPFFQAWSARNLIASPHPLHYLLAYGLVLPFAVAGARQMLGSDCQRGLLPVAWVLAVPLLLYSPIGVQRRLAEGVWVALVLLVVKSFDRPPLERSRLLHPAILLLAFPTTLFLLAGGFFAARSPSIPVFRPADEVAAMQALTEVAEPRDVVLASFESGNVLPAWAPVRVLVGSGPESIGLEDLLPRIQSFFQTSTTDAQRLAFLEEFNVRYLFWGPSERLLGGWDPTTATFLQLIFQQSDYSVFKVTTPP